MEKDFTSEFQQEEKSGIDPRKLALRIWRRWPAILGFFLASMAIGYAINRYSTPIYQIKGRITTKKYSGKQSSLVPGLVDASYFMGGITEVYEEIPLLKSPRKIEAALDKVDFRVSYFAKGVFKTVESIKGYGFALEIDSLSLTGTPYAVPIYVNQISEKEFNLFSENPDWNENFKNKKFYFGKSIKVGNASLKIHNTNGKLNEQDKYYFILNRKTDLVNRYRRKLDIIWAMKGSAMLDLRMNSELPERDIKFMKAYYEVVQEFGLAEKNEHLDNTIVFLEAQMKLVTDSISYYQSVIDGMKLENRKLQHGSEHIFTKLDELDKRRADILLNERYFDYLITYFNTKSQAEVFAPSLIGLDISPLEGWVNQFIQSKLKEKEYWTEENTLNPLVNREDSLKRKLVKGIFESIRSARERNKSVLEEISQQERILYGSVDEVQQGVRKLADFERIYQINNKLYDLFLNRRTESAITKSSATSDYKVIDEPSYSTAPIKPDTKMNLIIAAALGLLLPIGFLAGRELTNPTVRDADELGAIIRLPLLGNIAHSTYESKLVVRDHPRSVVAESFRSIRANLKYLSANIETPCRTFLLTSSIGGEGKTFCGINIAHTLALSQKKTVLIGADLRKPVMAKYLNIHAEAGLSTYLAGAATIEQVIIKGEDGQPDVIDAGPPPPNPSELLGGQRMAQIMAQLKEQYEYIIIDTAPIGLVADAMELFKFADYKILIVRQSVTPKAALRMVNQQYLEGKVGNLSVLFNDLGLVRRRGSIYGEYLYGMGYSGYGFGYYEGED